MAYEITKLLEQAFKKQVMVADPVSGSVDINEEVQILTDGSIVNGITGADNRFPGNNLGLLLLLIKILQQHHSGEEFSHELTDFEISPDAAISEEKLALDFFEMLRPDTGEAYSSTSQLASLINELYPMRNQLSQGALQAAALRQAVEEYLGKAQPVFFEGPRYGFITENNTLQTNADVMWFGATKILLRGFQSDDATNKIHLGALFGQATVPASLRQSGVVTIEMMIHNITQTGVGFPYGNIEYQNANNAEGENGLAFAHTDQAVLSGTSEFGTFADDPENGVFLNSESELVQWAYTLHYTTVNELASEWGPEDNAFRTKIGDETITESSKYPGVWVSSTGKYVIPLCRVSRRNCGIYHPEINPGGTALKRTGTILTNFSQCFVTNAIQYANTGTECPDYANAVFDAVSDTYTHLGTVYYRSGLTASGLCNSAIGSEGYADTLDEVYDIISFKRQRATAQEALALIEQMAIAGTLETSFIHTMYGVSSAMADSTNYAKRPIQRIGIGASEASVFGATNSGGVFIDRLNNGDNGVIDGVRRYWSDRAVSMPVTFTIVAGDPASESKPLILSYDSASRTLALNSTGLHGTVSIADEAPVLVWENGQTVLLSSTWTGLGSSTASCVIDNTDHTAHIGQTLYGSFALDYPKGSGFPFRIQNVRQILDQTNTPLQWKAVEDWNTFISWAYKGGSATGSTVGSIILDGLTDDTPSTDDDDYNGQYLSIITGGVLETRKIIDYNGSTKAASPETDFSSDPQEGDLVYISEFDPQEIYVVVDSLSRGIRGAVQRKSGTADINGVVVASGNILLTSQGTAQGQIITGLSEGDVVEFFEEHETLFTEQCIIEFDLDWQKPLFSTLADDEEFEFRVIGNLYNTNIGTANTPDEAYLLFAPTVSTPDPSGYSWIGQDAVKYFSIMESLKSITWMYLMPVEGLKFRSSDMTVGFELQGNRLTLRSMEQISGVNSGCALAFILAQSLNTYRHKLLMSVTDMGVYGFHTRENVFTVDVDKLFGIV